MKDLSLDILLTASDSYPRFLENLKLKWNWHNLRHKKASEWANSGMSTYEIMSRLGHSNMQTTNELSSALGIY